MHRYFTLNSADLVVPNQEAWGLLWDFQTLVSSILSMDHYCLIDNYGQRELVDTLPGNTPLQNEALTTANEIMNVFRSGDASSISSARAVAEKVLGSAWEELGPDVYKEGPKNAKIWGIGHCHIDTAWLWPYSVTQQKVARSWASQVDLMERYDEHRFAASSAQQYKWLQQVARLADCKRAKLILHDTAVPETFR
jgi:alpha-mannosidase